MSSSEAALGRCVGDLARFARDFWARAPLLHRSAGTFDDLLSLRDVDHMLSSMSLRLPAFRLVKEGSTVPASRYTRTGRTGSTTVTGIADPARIYAEFEGGATIVLQGMHRYWLPLTRFCRQLELALGHPTQVNAYITPAGSRGLGIHSDAHDVFVLQLFGTKHWEVFEREDPASTALTPELHPGDCLYMPVGTPHAARTQESVSGHLTIGVQTTSWAQLLGEALKAVEGRAEFAEPLPMGFHRDPQAFTVLVEHRLNQFLGWAGKMDAARVARLAIRRFLTTRPSILDGGLEDIVRLDSLDDGSLLRRREGSVCDLSIEGSQLVALLGDRELRMPAALLPAMRLVADGRELRVGDLGGLLDPHSRLVLARRLVREGLLEVADV